MGITMKTMIYAKTLVTYYYHNLLTAVRDMVARKVYALVKDKNSAQKSPPSPQMMQTLSMKLT